MNGSIFSRFSLARSFWYQLQAFAAPYGACYDHHFSDWSSGRLASLQVNLLRTCNEGGRSKWRRELILGPAVDTIANPTDSSPHLSLRSQTFYGTQVFWDIPEVLRFLTPIVLFHLPGTQSVLGVLGNAQDLRGKSGTSLTGSGQ